MIFNQQNSPKQKWLWAIFLLVAGYVLVSGVLVQRVIAPAVTDEWTPAGFIPELDSGGFHVMAVEMAENIREGGWENWELNPGWSANQPVGIMAAIYVFTGPSPIYLLPINAVIHGLSAVLLFLIFRFCGFQRKECFAGILPFAFFPSTLVWVAQFHKDGIYCLGLFSLFLGSLLILGRSEWKSRILGVGLVILGGAAISVVRDYAIMVFLIAAGFSGLLSQAIFIRRSEMKPSQSVAGLVLFFVSIALILPLAGEKGSEGKGEAVSIKSETVTVIDREPPAQKQPVEQNDYTPPPTPWVKSSWLPAFVDERVHQLIHNRTIFIWLFPNATSYVDEDKVFRSAGDVVAYIPRALLIGLLAPFPDQWYDETTTLTGNLQRMVSGAEMIVAYTLLGAGFIYLVKWPSKASVFLVFSAALMILALVYPLPAVGSLYRIRFGPYSILLGIGAASLVRIWILSRLKRRENIS